MTHEIKKPEGSLNELSASAHQQIPAGDRHDPADGLQLRGWPALAKMIAENSSLEAFQAFRDLHVKSLLYYQAELVLLRNKLHAVEFEDSKTGETRDIKGASEFRTDLASLLASRDNKDPKMCKQWTLITQIRGVLKNMVRQ
jgi:hypothetical protein